MARAPAAAAAVPARCPVVATVVGTSGLPHRYTLRATTRGMPCWPRQGVPIYLPCNSCYRQCPLPGINAPPPHQQQQRRSQHMVIDGSRSNGTNDVNEAGTTVHTHAQWMSMALAAMFGSIMQLLDSSPLPGSDNPLLIMAVNTPATKNTRQCSTSHVRRGTACSHGVHRG